jgi:DNA-binding CsgD family transcriptional regulator
MIRGLVSAAAGSRDEPGASSTGDTDRAGEEGVPEKSGDRVLEAHSLGEEADAQAAVDVWRALVAGRWSVVDHCDRGGKRFLLAVANSRKDSDSSSLTAREVQILARVALRHSLKLVSYELGLSHSTVSGQLQSALRKLRLGSVAEAVRVLGAGQSLRRG